MKKLSVFKLLIAIFLFVSAGLSIYLSFKLLNVSMTATILTMAASVLLGVFLLCIDSKKRILHIIPLSLLLLATTIDFAIVALAANDIDNAYLSNDEIVVLISTLFAVASVLALLIYLFIGLFKRKLSFIPSLALGGTSVAIYLFIFIFTVIKKEFVLDSLIDFVQVGLLIAAITIYAIYVNLLAVVDPGLPAAIIIAKDEYRHQISLHDINILQKLGELKNDGHLTDNEFIEAKKDILSKRNKK